MRDMQTSSLVDQTLKGCADAMPMIACHAGLDVQILETNGDNMLGV